MQKSTLLLLLLLAIITGACSVDKQPAVKQPVAVDEVEATSGNATSNHNYVGTIVEREGTSLSFEVPGNIISLNADAGDKVVRGQLLGVVDPTTLRNAHNLTLATLKQAKDAYKRFEPLHSQGVLSDIKWVEVQTKLEQAQSAERVARQQLQRTSLRAPFSGVIASRQAQRGMNVTAGQPVFRLVDVSQVDVKMSVPENEVSAIAIGQMARVVVAAANDGTYEAVVREKGIEANPISHTYNVKLEVRNANRKLMPGMVCSVAMQRQGAQESQAETIIVPLQAVKLDIDNRRFVWLDVAGKAKQQYITIADFASDGVVVTSGLHNGDKVITTGSQKVSEGMAVKARK